MYIYTYVYIYIYIYIYIHIYTYIYIYPYTLAELGDSGRKAPSGGLASASAAAKSMEVSALKMPCAPK